MRAALVLVALLLATPVAARVITVPYVVRECSEKPSWDAVAACLGKLGTVEVARDLPHARLARFAESADLNTSKGFYLYVDTGKQWRLAGMYESGEETELLAASTIDDDHHTAYRIDIGETTRTFVEVGDSSVPAVVIQKYALLCGTGSWRCSAVLTSCDVLVHGRARWSFRGTLQIKHGWAEVAGDRSKVGETCRPPDKFSLPWATGED